MTVDLKDLVRRARRQNRSAPKKTDARRGSRSAPAQMSVREVEDMLDESEDVGATLAAIGEKVLANDDFELWVPRRASRWTPGGPWVAKYRPDSDDARVYETRDFVLETDVDDVFPDEEQRFHDEFWENPSPLYHATQADRVSGISRRGLEAKAQSRGVSNRWVSSAVFTTVDEEEAWGGSYGPVVYEVDTLAMKEAGLTPRVAQEEAVREYELRGRLAHVLGTDAEFDLSEDMSPNTVVVFGAVPRRFLKKLP